LADSLRVPPQCDNEPECEYNCCTSPLASTAYYIVFVVLTKLILLNVVVAMLSVHMNEATKEVLAASIIDAVSKADKKTSKAKTMAQLEAEKADVGKYDIDEMFQDDTLFKDENEVRDTAYGNKNEIKQRGIEGSSMKQ